MAALAPPITPPHNFILPILRILTAILNPFSLSYSRFSTGIFTSLKNTCLVEDPLIPIFFSSAFSVIPGVSASTKNAVKFLSSSILAKTVKRLANPPLVIHIF